MHVFLSALGNTIDLVPGETIVGRDTSCRVRLLAPSVSRRHARLWVADGRIVIADLRSRNGTFVNGERLTAPCPIEVGDEIVFGDVTMTVVGSDDVHEFETETDTTSLSATDEPDVTAAISLVTRPSDNRRHRRHAVTLPIVYESDNLRVEAVSLNLSRSGVFIRTVILDAVGTGCRLTLEVGDRNVEVRGLVRRVVEVERDEPTGLGIEFLELDYGVRDALEAMVHGH